MGKLVIGWHKDKHMVPHSSIACYQYTEGDDQSNFWAVAFKKAWEVTTNPLLIKLNSGETYFMLDSFNDETRHAVIGREGSWPRFSSTHRCSNTERNTYEYISERAAKAVSISEDLFGLLTSDVTDPSLFELLHVALEIQMEMECEWIRKFWIRGSRHAEQHFWWLSRINKLEETWEKLEESLNSILLEILEKEIYDQTSLSKYEKHLKDLKKKRNFWYKYGRASFFKALPEFMQPISKPIAKFSVLSQQLKRIHELQEKKSTVEPREEAKGIYGNSSLPPHKRFKKM
eukprot:TRINITY_DN8093_c0_g1_i1.p1 TRINITY_DN8093_c0_g1~~TRINITY_DN8093_c0_g1_i1.p1  ORF type:complete len:288 (-),score=63.86 TRINITY_DN8093_c0_g1_i1:155-1018(-)